MAGMLVLAFLSPSGLVAAAVRRVGRHAHAKRAHFERRRRKESRGKPGRQTESDFSLRLRALVLDPHRLLRGFVDSFQVRLEANPRRPCRSAKTVSPGQIAEAQQKNDEARQLLAEYEKKLADAAAEVRGLIEQGRRDAEKVGQQLLDKAREEAGIEHQRAVQRIESATSAAIEDIARAQRRRLPSNWPARSSAPAQAGRPQPADRAGGDRVHPFTQGQRANRRCSGTVAEVVACSEVG